MDLEELFKIAIEKNASDIHFVPGYSPSVRINGQLYVLKSYPVIDAGNKSKEPFANSEDEQKATSWQIKKLILGFSMETCDFV